MATSTVSQNRLRGGAFLITPCQPEDVFTPADLSDDQRLIGQTAEEFVANEVLPVTSELEQHKEGLMAQLLKKAGEIGLLGGAIPEAYGGAGLDKVSATVLAEKLSAYASFAVTHGGHAGRAIAGRQKLDFERAENVDHERRLRGRVHRVC
jgi:alkylation response protein AidB-like acyl-CoA dehydrogenase